MKVDGDVFELGVFCFGGEFGLVDIVFGVIFFECEVFG